MDLSNLTLQAPTGHPPHAWTPEERVALDKALRQVADAEGRFSKIPGAHEFADAPPPTVEDYRRFDKALDTIFDRKDSTMTEVTATTNIDDLIVTQSEEAATALLQQDGWAIVRELHAAALDSISQTGLAVLPIMANLDDYKLILKDPVGFEQRFETLSNDISMVMVTAKALGAKSEGKTGKPNAADIELISSLTMDYTKVQGYIERSIQPLILVLIDELEAVGVTELKIEQGK
jgi:hypothetical protein